MWGTDEKETAKIERRRRMEEERKAKIFDVKNRKLGEVVQEQIKSKKDKEKEEKDREMAFAKQQEQLYQQLDVLTAKREQEKRQYALEVLQFNKELSTQKQQTLRSSTQEPQSFGVSSAQQLHGEDPQQKERLKMQQQQMKDWATQQMIEKQERARREKDMERLYQTRMREIDQRIQELEAQQFKNKADMLNEDKEINKQLADQKREKEIKDKINETFNNLDEIKTQTTGAFLTENPSVSIRVDNPNRVVPYAFKGMTPERVKEIYEEQPRQQREKELKRQKEKEEERKWQEMQEMQRKMVTQMEQEAEFRRREEQRKIQEENKKRAEEIKERYNRLNKEYTSNQPTEDFFGQFNTTTR